MSKQIKEKRYLLPSDHLGRNQQSWLVMDCGQAAWSFVKMAFA